jgi:hypothetical protein
MRTNWFFIACIAGLGVAFTAQAQTPGIGTNPPPANQQTAFSPSTGTNNTLTPDDWQKLRQAHLAALKDHPELAAKARELADRMRDFQSKLQAAMIKDDPKVGHIIAQLKGGHPTFRNDRLPDKSP